MKKRISLDLLFLFVNLFLIIFVAYFYYMNNRDSYVLDVPLLDDIDSIYLVFNEKEKYLQDYEEIKVFYSLIEKNWNTTILSIQDMPENTDEIFSIQFYFKDGRGLTMFLYKRKNKYYLEQPYNGIYEITKDVYGNFKNYFYEGR